MLKDGCRPSSVPQSLEELIEPRPMNFYSCLSIYAVCLARGTFVIYDYVV